MAPDLTGEEPDEVDSVPEGERTEDLAEDLVGLFGRSSNLGEVKTIMLM